MISIFLGSLHDERTSQVVLVALSKALKTLKWRQLEKMVIKGNQKRNEVGQERGKRTIETGFTLQTIIDNNFFYVHS